MADNNKIFNDALSIAQTLIRSDKEKATPALIAEKVKIAVALYTGQSAEPLDQDAMVAELIRRFSHWIGKISTLQDDVGHVPWLVAARKKDWRYWQRYRTYMERKLADDVVENLNDSTDDILGLLEDPRREGVWDRRGLVVGHVQSGKTGNYSGLICKAADAGYKIIIVLAGMHNNLRSQTQIRLEESFLGYETSPNRDPGKPLGVAEFDSDQKINPHCGTTRADNGDFNAAVANHFAAISPEERPWLFVVKKNKTVLTQLLTWIRTRVADATAEGTDRKVVTYLPLLVIDDEADNGSVDTGEQVFNADGTPDEEHTPKTINSLIRKILHAFSRSAYVGYTATPFANIYIHRKGSTKEEGPDLFPQSFIVNLAAPSNYVGPVRVFGRATPEGREGGLPLTHLIEDHYDVENKTGWMPPKHNKEHVPIFNGQETIPPSLREALYSFVISCAVRSTRGQDSEHSSMLIHVTRLVQVQNHVRFQVEEAVKRMRQRIDRGVDAEELLAQLHHLWVSDFLPCSATIANLVDEEERSPPMPTWDEVLGAIPNVLHDIQVRSVNGTARDALDYSENQGPGLKVIAIGGDKLARGLTLEGLCTSYFVRTTKMYDTLMQMGRWFGYRPGYLDLCRLYTSEDLVEWFGHIADASEELREEFDNMVERKGTPNDYGLRVKSHPVLTVTSRLKMRNSQNLSLSYSGSMVQTVALFDDKTRNERNLNATDRLISAMGVPAINGLQQVRVDFTDSWKRSPLWTDVGSELILDFLRGYETHPDATSAKSPVLADFIKKMNDQGELRLWTVALLAEGHPGTAHKFSTGLTISNFPARSNRKKDRYTIGVLTDPSDEAIDLDFDDWKKALELTVARWKPDPARNRITVPTKPSGKVVREVRGAKDSPINRGLLLLYPLSPLDGNRPIVKDWELPVMAFAMGFPASETGVSVEYDVNLLYWEQEYGPSE